MERTLENEKTPRRYGKVLIEKDIEQQGGKPTELQLTMLELNELKSIYLNLLGKGTSDHYKGTNKITEQEGRIIREAIEEFRRKVSPMLIRKRG